MIDQIVVDGVVWLLGFIPQASGFALKLTLTPPPIPEALSETDELKPLVGVEVMLVVFEELRATEKLDGEERSTASL